MVTKFVLSFFFLKNYSLVPVIPVLNVAILYTTYDEPSSVGLQTFDSVLTVLQRDQDLGALEKDYFVEMYAKNIGLIYKEAIHLEQDLVDPTWLNPERGYRYTMTISSFNVQ